MLLVIFSAAMPVILYGLFLALFRRGRRKKGLKIFATAVVVFFVTGLVIGRNETIARKEGWASSGDRARAERAGVTTPVLWAEYVTAEEENRKVAQADAEVQAKTEAEAKAKAEAEAAALAEEKSAAAQALEETWAKRRAAVQAAAAADALASRKAAKDAKARENGEHCFSPWDGSHRHTIDAIKTALRNPRSFEHVETRFGKSRQVPGAIEVQTIYRAENGFGGMNIEAVRSIFEPQSCLVLSIESADP